LDKIHQFILLQEQIQFFQQLHQLEEEEEEHNLQHHLLLKVWQEDLEAELLVKDLELQVEQGTHHQYHHHKVIQEEQVNHLEEHMDQGVEEELLLQVVKEEQVQVEQVEQDHQIQYQDHQ
jgi:vacuolar-type H+-ATPase subunit I/STV1